MKRVTIWEDKICPGCDTNYQSSQYNKSGLCKKCTMKKHNERNRMKEEDYKKPYPLKANEKKKRYSRIQRELNKAYTKEERRAIYARELDFMIESGIWEWCIDRRDTKHVALEPGKIGRKPLEYSDVNIKHPDTRYMNE